MTFNPMMALLVRAAVEWLEPKPTVVELGNQTFTPDDATLRRVIAHSRGGSGLDCGGLERLLRRPAPERRDGTEAYYRCLGFSEYQAIDVNDAYGSLVMDLNRDLREAYGFSRTFSLVTNNGTAEHVFDQAAVLRNVHALARPGGLMLHLLPFLRYVNHGFYCYHPNLFSALAAANGYRLVALGLGNRHGQGAFALPAPEEEAAAMSLEVLPAARWLDLATLLAEPKLAGPGLGRRLARRVRRWRGVLRPGDRLAAAIEWLQRSHRNLLVFAVLRKLADTPFRVPIQGLYAGALSDPELRARYAPAPSGPAGGPALRGS